MFLNFKIFATWNSIETKSNLTAGQTFAGCKYYEVQYTLQWIITDKTLR